MSCLRHCLILLVAASLWIASGHRACAQGANVVVQENRLKAAFIYNFSSNVTWPAAQGNDFVIGIYGSHPVTKLLQPLQGKKTTDGKTIAIRQFDTMAQYAPSQILFISRFAGNGIQGETPGDRLKAAVKQTQNSPVLLVSESPGFAQEGAHINFVVDRRANRLRMEVNVKAARAMQLTFSAKFLRLSNTGAVIIVGNAAAGNE
jgi:hypothetical protein